MQMHLRRHRPIPCDGRRCRIQIQFLAIQCFTLKPLGACGVKLCHVKGLSLRRVSGEYGTMGAWIMSRLLKN